MSGECEWGAGYADVRVCVCVCGCMCVCVCVCCLLDTSDAADDLTRLSLSDIRNLVNNTCYIHYNTITFPSHHDDKYNHNINSNI